MSITKTSLKLLTKQSFMVKINSYYSIKLISIIYNIQNLLYAHIYFILQGIFEELMLNFYESPQGIIGFLEIISEYDSNQRGNFNTQEQVVSLLN